MDTDKHRWERAGQKSPATSLVSIFTLVLWLMCLAVGVLGFALPYPVASPSVKPVPPVKATILNVELTTQPVPKQLDTPPPKVSEPPPLTQPVMEPAAPPMIAVAAPNPAIAFALPVAGPSRVVDARQADFKRPTTPSTAVASSKPQPLVFGEGEGKQQAPEYPARAQREGQEGTVIIRFNLDELGRVIMAEVSRPSPWPLLNNAALMVVREHWRFRAGPLRCYEVPIKFELEK